MELNVTGLRYRMGNNLTPEEQTAKAEVYIKKLKNGTPVILVGEPDNEFDEHAIAVYIDYEKRGYVAREECELVSPLLNENSQCDAIVCGNDGHITYYVTIPHAADFPKKVTPHERTLPPSPVSKALLLPFSEEDRRIQIIAPRLVETPITKENIEQLLILCNSYLPFANLSICHEDDRWRKLVFQKIKELKSCSFLNKSQSNQCQKLYDVMRKVIGEVRREKDHWAFHAFEGQLNDLREKAKKANYVKKFQDFYIDNPPKRRKERLEEWFKNMPWVELRDYQHHEALARKLCYIGVTRRELYDIYSTLIFLDELTTEDDMKEIPDILQTEDAKSVLGNFIYNRLLTEELQPIDLSGTEQALLAKYICDRLKIIEVWQVFGNLWNIKPETLRTYFNRALEQRKSLKFQEKIKEMIG